MMNFSKLQIVECIKIKIPRRIFLSLLLIILTGCNLESELVDNDYTDTIIVSPNPVVIVKEVETFNDVSIIMVGDNLLHDRLFESGLKDDGSYNYEHLYKNTKEFIQAFDIAIVNQEVILGGVELELSGYPLFNSGYEVADALVDTGFDVICHSTNHAIDQGYQGVENCINYWEENYPDIGVVGINKSLEKQDQIYVKEVNGIKIAILNYTYGLNGLNLPESKSYLVNLLIESEVVEDIIQAENIADFTIVCPHWGNEYTHLESEYQKKWADIMVSNGADLIIGTHPHVIQPVKWEVSENGNEALVYYSLGNYINATNQYGNVSKRMLGEMASVTIQENNDNVEIISYVAIPIVSHIAENPLERTVYLLDDYTEELAKKNLIHKQDSKFSLEYINNLWSRMIIE
jgi:poly-gamma-glutamate synthesis protein (capsule biosynthesis protein)